MSPATWICVFVTCFAVFQVVRCKPMTELDMMEYLKTYGYLGEKEITDMDNNEMKNAVKEFQEFYALPITGKMDDKTREMMERPRCGRPDKGSVPAKAIARRGSRWRKRTLTYRLRGLPRNGYGKANALKETKRAFNVWANVANVNFRETNGRADIDIYFPAASEGDGPGKTLAYAYYPEKGDIYFDAENWTLRGRSGINYFQVATHEIGHSLGLPHISGVPQAVMAPYYHGYLPNYRLHRTDISRIRDKYGGNRLIATNNTFCDSMQLDSVFATSRNEIFVLNNNQVWKYTNQKLVSGYPKTLDEQWPGLPMNIDAAYFLEKKFYFFKDTMYFVYEGNKKLNISNNAVTQNIDAGFVMDDRIYLFIGNNYLKYSLRPQIKLAPGYPKAISSFWKGVPNNIDTVYYDFYRTVYFFKNKKMYKFNISTKTTVSEDVSNWFPCKGS